MTHYSSSRALASLVRSFKRLDTSDPLTQCLTPRLSRPFASQAKLPVEDVAREIENDLNPGTTAMGTNSATTHAPTSPQIFTTLYQWPDLMPKRFAHYNPKLLDLPLRRDLLHRAVIYEADASRQGTASTKWRKDVHGSNRKLFAQKGTGRARAGDKKSPIRRGGGVAFGPHPRDFSTDLPRKMYDLAWRTALSHRYRKGELIIIDDEITIPTSANGRLLSNIFLGNKWGKANGRSLLVTEIIRDHLYDAMDSVGEHGLVKDIRDVDVKDLLETGRVVIEKRALDALLCTHVADLGVKLDLDRALTANLDPIVHFDGALSLDRRTGMLNIPEVQEKFNLELDE